MISSIPIASMPIHVLTLLTIYISSPVITPVLNIIILVVLNLSQIGYHVCMSEIRISTFLGIYKSWFILKPVLCYYLFY